MNLKVYILPPLSLIFSQAMLNIVVYQMLIVTNVCLMHLPDAPMDSPSLKLRLIFMSTNLERARERQRKRGGRPAKFNEEKGDRNLERQIKNTKETFF